MKIFVSFDFDNDRQYKYTLNMWNGNGNIDFEFNDVSTREIQSWDISGSPVINPSNFVGSLHTCPSDPLSAPDL